MARDIQRMANRMWQMLRFSCGSGSGECFACKASHDFIKEHRFLENAWQASQRPGWMRWWLYDFMGCSNLESTGGNFYGTEVVDPEACDEIRRTWTYWGERKDDRNAK